MISDEVRQLRSVISSQLKELEELREFSAIESGQREQEAVDQARTIAALESRVNQLLRDLEEGREESKRREEAHRSDLQRLGAASCSLRAEVADEAVKSVLKSEKSSQSEDVEGFVDRNLDIHPSVSESKSVVRHDLSFKIARKQMMNGFKILAAYNLASLKRRRFWDHQSHRHASFVCNIVDDLQRPALP